MTIGYHLGHRRLQDEFESRKIADRLDDFARTAFTDDDKAFIEACPFFLIATADDQGRPDCSHKGGLPGFVQVSAPDKNLVSGISRTVGSRCPNSYHYFLPRSLGRKPPPNA